MKYQTCPECLYLQQERSGIHMTHGRLNQTKSDELSKAERCNDHRNIPATNHGLARTTGNRVQGTDNPLFLFGASLSQH